MTKTQTPPNRTATRKPRNEYLHSRTEVHRAFIASSNAGPAAEYAEALVELQEVIDDSLTHAVARMRWDGLSWSEIGAALHTSPQAAHRKYSSSTVDDE